MPEANLSNRNFGNRNINHLAAALSRISSETTALNLSDNSLDVFSSRLGYLLQRLPDKIKSINLNNNYLGDFCFMHLCSCLPRRISTIALANNDLGSLSAQELKSALSLLPKQIKSVDLSNNNLVNINIEIAPVVVLYFLDLLGAFLHILTFNLSTGLFNPIPFISIFWGLTVFTAMTTYFGIGASANQTLTISLLFSNFAALLAIFSLLIPAPLLLPVSLIIWNVVPLIAICNLVPLIAVKVIGNFIYVQSQRSAPWYEKVCSALLAGFSFSPKTGLSTDLSGKPMLSTALSGLPASVTTLNLSNNKLGQFTQEELVALIAAIPSSVTQINLEHNGLFSGKSPKECDELINALTPYNTHGRLNLENNGENTINRTTALLLAMRHQPVAGVRLSRDVMNSIAEHLGGGSQFFTPKSKEPSDVEHDVALQASSSSLTP